MTLQERLEVCLVRAMFLLAPDSADLGVIKQVGTWEPRTLTEDLARSWELYLDRVAARTA